MLVRTPYAVIRKSLYTCLDVSAVIEMVIGIRAHSFNWRYVNGKIPCISNFPDRILWLAMNIPEDTPTN